MGILSYKRDQSQSRNFPCQKTQSLEAHRSCFAQAQKKRSVPWGIELQNNIICPFRDQKDLLQTPSFPFFASAIPALTAFSFLILSFSKKSTMKAFL